MFNYDEYQYEQFKAWGDEQEHLISEGAAAEAQVRIDSEEKPMKIENPYQYKRGQMPMTTNEKIALCQGWQEGFDAAAKMMIEEIEKFQLEDCPILNCWVYRKCNAIRFTRDCEWWQSFKQKHLKE